MSYRYQKISNLLLPIAIVVGFYFAVNYVSLITLLIALLFLLYIYAKSNYDIGRIEGYIEGEQDVSQRWSKTMFNHLSMIPDLSTAPKGKDLERLKKEWENAQK